jgi:mannitol/fructose-specific phosphotransferase system IIA component (Ntr-type)
MRLTDILLPACIRVPLASRTKKDAVFELVDLLADAHGIVARQELKDAVWERETTRTTGIGHGIAIPHGKTPGCRSLVMAVGKPAEPIEFGAIDNRPVDLILMLASPVGQTGPHIQALASVSHMLVDDEVRQAFREARDPLEVLRLVEQHQPRL